MCLSYHKFWSAFRPRIALCRLSSLLPGTIHVFIENFARLNIFRIFHDTENIAYSAEKHGEIGMSYDVLLILNVP